MEKLPKSSPCYDEDHYQKPGFLAKFVNYLTKTFNLKNFILSNFIFKPPKIISTQNTKFIYLFSFEINI